MKKVVITILAILAVTVSRAANNPEAVNVRDIKVTQANGLVSLSFTLSAGKKATKKNYNLVINPVLENNVKRLQLPSIVIFGKRAKITQERHSLNGGYNYHGQTFYTANGESVRYEASFLHEPWMTGSRLIFEGVSVGCCSSREVLLGPIAENLLAAPQQPVEKQEYPSFVKPISQYEGGMFDRTGAITVYFHQAKTNIDPWLFNNDRTLAQILSSVREIQASNAHRVSRVVIAGYASPEGTSVINHRLGRDRGQVIKDYIVRHTGMNPNMISTHNGEVDWSGLREYVVNSDMPEKHRILHIIDNTPIWDSYRNVGRLGELQRLGEPYHYMYRTYFPLLRQAAYIKIYYDDK